MTQHLHIREKTINEKRSDFKVVGRVFAQCLPLFAARIRITELLPIKSKLSENNHTDGSLRGATHDEYRVKNSFSFFLCPKWLLRIFSGMQKFGKIYDSVARSFGYSRYEDNNRDIFVQRTKKEEDPTDD